MNVWNFAERKAAIVPVLQQLVRDGRIQPQILAHIEHLYARRLDFEAERVAGLAIWAGKGKAEDTLATFFEYFGIVLRAVRSAAAYLQKADILHSWTRVAPSKPAFLRTLGVSLGLYEKLLRLPPRLLPEPPAGLAERGKEIRTILQFLAGRGELTGSSRGVVVEGVARGQDIIAAIDTAAEQLVTTLLVVGRHIGQVWTWEEWRKVAASYEEFLDGWLGLGVPCGSQLSVLGHDIPEVQTSGKPLRRLELIVSLTSGRLAQAVGSLDGQRA